MLSSRLFKKGWAHMDIELTQEEFFWMLEVYRGEFRIIPRHVVRSVIGLGLGIPNLGGAFNLTPAGREVVRSYIFSASRACRNRNPGRGVAAVVASEARARAGSAARFRHFGPASQTAYQSGYEKILKMFSRNS